jgi:hypothetical protein
MRPLTVLVIFTCYFFQKNSFCQLEPFGLLDKGKTIVSTLPETSWLENDFVWAGTYDKGVYVYNFNLPDSGWTNLGLNNDTLTSLTVQHHGTGPGEFNRLVVGIKPREFNGEIAMLLDRMMVLPIYYSSWRAIDYGSEGSGFESLRVYKKKLDYKI